MNTLTQIALAASFTALLAPHALLAQPSANGTKRAQAVVDHWTPARRAAATPRDLVIDATGQGYLRRADGTLEPYGQARAPRLKAAPISPRKRPPDGGGGGGGGGGGDTGDGGGGTGSAGPAISGLTPDGETIGASHTFSTVVTDADGVKSVTFVLTYPNGSTTQSFSASNAGGDTWALQRDGLDEQRNRTSPSAAATPRPLPRRRSRS